MATQKFVNKSDADLTSELQSASSCVTSAAFVSGNVEVTWDGNETDEDKKHVRNYLAQCLHKEWVNV